LVEGLAEKTRAALLDSMPKGTNSVHKWFRILAIAIVCLALVYTVMEALDSSAITDSNFEFEALTALTVVGVLVAFIQLILLAFRMLIWGRNRLVMVLRIWTQRWCESFSVLRPPGSVPLRS
jgi:hypothetical protein